MKYRMTASADAIHACDYEDTIYWLQPRSAAGSASENAGSRETFRHVTASLGLGALLTFGSAGAAIGPALASPSEPFEVAAPSTVGAEIAPEADAPADLMSDIGLPPVDTAELPLIVIAEVPVEPTPSQAIASVPAADSSGPALALATAEPSTQSTALDASSAPEPQAVATAAETRVANDPQELLQFDDMRVPRWIVETILKASDVTGVDPVYMMALADKESSFVPANKAGTSSAEGLFQFISSTWLEVVRSFGAKHGLAAEAAAITRVGGQLSIADETTRDHVLGLRRDPYLSALMAAEMMKRDRAKVERRLGRSISRSEFYLAHFFGVDSASKFMALLDGKSKQSAPRVFPKAAKANKTLFFVKKGRKTRQLSVAEVYSKIDGMIDKRLDRYQGVMTAVSSL